MIYSTEYAEMARPGITYFDVAKAAIQLREQNLRPSIEAVRLLLGTGSNSTINQHLRQWRQHHGNQIECEQGLPESLLIAVKGTYDAICAQANSQLEKITLEHKQSTDELQLKQTSLEKKYYQIVQQKSQLESSADQAEEEKLALEKLNQQLNHTIHEKITETNALSDKLSDRETQINRLTQQINHFQASLDHYRNAIREERITEKQAFEGDLSVLKKQLAAERHVARQADEKNIKLQQTLEYLTSEKQAAENKFETVLEKYQILKTDLQKMNWQTNNLQQQIESRQSELQIVTQTSKQDKELITELNLSLVKQQEQIVHYKHTTEKSEDKMANLSHKNLFLTQEKAELAGQLKQILDTK